MMNKAPGSTPEKQPTRDFFNPDFYKRLGVSRDATEKDLKKSYLEAAKEALTLDVKDGSEKSGEANRRKSINEAYLCLKNPATRRKYDGVYQFESSGSSFSQRPETKPSTEAEQKNNAIESIKNAVMYPTTGYSKGFFEKEREKWVKAGILTMEEINNSPIIKDKIIERLGSAIPISIHIHSILGPTPGEIFIENRDIWVNLGVMTKNEINSSPFIKNKVADLLGSIIGSDEIVRFQKERDLWIKAGVLTVEEMATVTKEKVTRHLETTLHWQGGKYFKKVRDEWVKAGIITKTETEQILKEYKEK